jgi:EmrB/QacA subfamily drug resistance transporter
MTTKSPPRRAVIVGLTAIAYFMVTLDALVVVTALPSIHRAFGGGIGTLQWTVSAYTMTFGALIITAAALGDRLGRRRIYVAGLALFTAASAACALAPDAGALIAFRAVQGAGAAVIMPLGLTLLTGAFPAQRRGAVIGIWGGIAGLAVACGPLVGGAITQGLSWHWIFWVNVPIGVAAVIGARLRLPESRGARARLDLPGVALITVALTLLIWGLVRGGQDGWATAPTAAVLVAGVVLLAGFVAWERVCAEPMIPLGLFRVPAFAAAAGTQLCMAAAIFSAAFLTSQFFQLGLRLSPLATGLRFLPWTATPLLVAPLAGALSDRAGARTLIVPGLVLQGTGLAWIVHLAGTSAGYAGYVAPFVIAGCGISMALPCVPAAGLNAVSPASLGKAAGVLNTAQQFGAVLGVAVVSAVFGAQGSLASPAALTHGYRYALAVAAAISVLGALAAVAIRRRSQPAVAQAPAGALEAAAAAPAAGVSGQRVHR